MAHSRSASRRRPDWLVPVGLVALSFVPVAAGGSRLAQLAGGAQITPENARFFAVPLPVVLHIICASIFALVGAWQFSPGFRRSRRTWHRVAGRIVVPCGLITALSGLWMTLFYPRPVGDGDLLEALRLVFGSAMFVSLVLGYTAARRRAFVRHRIWITRGYAIGLGADTQVLTQVPWILAFGTPGEFIRALLMGAGWVINLAVVEYTLPGHRRDRSPDSSASTPTTAAR